MNQRTRNQGGWVASFVVIGVILVLGLLAGLYYVKTRQLENNGAIATETHETTSDSNKNAPDQPSSDDDSDKKDTPPKATDDTTPSKDEQKSDEQPSDDNKTTSVPDSSEDSNELPTTGPSDTAAQLIAVFALTVSGVAYVGSRRGL